MPLNCLTRPGATLLLLLFLSTVASALAGWDSVPYQSSAPIHAEGALLLHDDGTAVQAFSASTSRWTAIAPTGSNILGTGDWTGLVELPDRLVAYSSRLNSTAVIGVSSSPELVLVGDAVLLAIVQGATGGRIAHAYSADTNSFSSIPYTPTGIAISADVAVSRFVIVLRSTTGIYGFSARHGGWVQLTASTTGGEPQADGNVGLLELPPPVGVAYGTAAAFSGVTGDWSVSPAMYAGSARLDHNVAYVEATDTAGHFRASAYSAYNGRWITSTVVRTLASQGVYLSDNHVTLQSIMPAEPGLEAIALQSGNRNVFGYSVQRGNWIEAGAAAGPPLLPPAVEENVGWFVDSAGELFALGSHGDLHSWYQYPNGTEFQATGLAPISSPPSPFGVTFAGDPGEQVLLLLALAPNYPGIQVGSWLNPLCLDPVSLVVVGPLGAIGPIGLLPVVSQLGTQPAPVCAQIWLQGAFTGGPLGKRLGIRCEPMPIF
ncbi:MAG: hypothetical protein V2A76_00750 [Planctomycetota bacterium]